MRAREFVSARIAEDFLISYFFFLLFSFTSKQRARDSAALHIYDPRRGRRPRVANYEQSAARGASIYSALALIYEYTYIYSVGVMQIRTAVRSRKGKSRAQRKLLFIFCFYYSLNNFLNK